MKADKLSKIYRAYPILNRINEKNKKLLDQAFHFKNLENREYLREQECSGFVFIIKGHIKIERIDLEGRQTSLYEIGKGEICHESLSCYLNCSTLEIVGYALTTTQIGILPRECVEKYLLTDIEFMKYLYKDLYRKFNMLINHKESIIHESIEERLLKYIRDKNKEIIYATHQEIALELGTSREVVSRKLKRLEEEGILKLSRGKISIIKKI